MPSLLGKLWLPVFCGRLLHRIFSCANERTVASVPSVQPSPMTISSKSLSVWPSTDSMLGLMCRPRPNVAITTEKRGLSDIEPIRNPRIVVAQTAFVRSTMIVSAGRHVHEGRRLLAGVAKAVHHARRNSQQRRLRVAQPENGKLADGRTAGADVTDRNLELSIAESQPIGLVLVIDPGAD